MISYTGWFIEERQKHVIRARVLIIINGVRNMRTCNARSCRRSVVYLRSKDGRERGGLRWWRTSLFAGRDKENDIPCVAGTQTAVSVSCVLPFLPAAMPSNPTLSDETLRFHLSVLAPLKRYRSLPVGKNHAFRRGLRCLKILCANGFARMMMEIVASNVTVYFDRY